MEGSRQAKARQGKAQQGNGVAIHSTRTTPSTNYCIGRHVYVYVSVYVYVCPISSDTTSSRPIEYQHRRRTLPSDVACLLVDTSALPCLASLPHRILSALATSKTQGATPLHSTTPHLTYSNCTITCTVTNSVSDSSVWLIHLILIH